MKSTDEKRRGRSGRWAIGWGNDRTREVGKDQVFIYNDKYIIELFFPKKRKNEKYHYMGIGRYGKNSQICIVIQK
jgi:hypothetical protein